MEQFRGAAVFLLFAAGQSRRYRQNKLLESLPDGATVLQRSYNNIRAVSDKVVVVSNKALPQTKNALTTEKPCILEIDTGGLSDSIAGAVHYTRAAKGWVICLADMPFLSPAIFRRLLDEMRRAPDKIIRPRCGEYMGHPVYFGGRFLDELCLLSGDEGAKKIVQKYKHDVLSFDLGDSCVLRDLDRPSDLPTKK